VRPRQVSVSVPCLPLICDSHGRPQLTSTHHIYSGRLTRAQPIVSVEVDFHAARLSGKFWAPPGPLLDHGLNPACSNIQSEFWFRNPSHQIELQSMYTNDGIESCSVRGSLDGLVAETYGFFHPCSVVARNSGGDKAQAMHQALQ
jgi:hypothetical protein